MGQERIREWLRDNPLAADLALAMGLGLLTALQIWAFRRIGAFPEMAAFGPGPRIRVRLQPVDFTLAYLVTAAAFLPLGLRRHMPWLALALSGSATVVYEVMRTPPALVVLAPMVALYTLVSDSRRRNATLFVLLGAGVAVAVSALAITQDRWLVDGVRTFVLLATAAFLGESARGRRQYIAEVEQRALEAERTREEEAHRRVDEERLRIARDVHDVVAHSLSIVAVQAAAADRVASSHPEAARESIRNVRDTSRTALAELRSMLGVLRTGEAEAPLEPAPCLAGLERLAEQVREAGVAVGLRAEGDLGEVPAVTSVSAYRIVQEALTNVVRHAGASSADVTIVAGGDALEVEVLDDGIGAAASDLGSGHGLRGMAERAEALGGTLEVGPREDRSGFRVRAVLPTSRRVL